MPPIEREHTTFSLTIASSKTSTSQEVGAFAWGSFQAPAAMTSTAFTVQVSNDDNTFTALATADFDGLPVGVVNCTASGSYKFPDGVFAFSYVRLVGNSTEAASRTFRCIAKT